MIVVMKKITLGALLSPSEASEEFRLGIIRCFKAMLLRLQPCSTMSCSCKQRVILPTVECFMTLPAQPGTLSIHGVVESEECFIAFLQSHNASAAVGHWLSLLLQVGKWIIFLLVFMFFYIIASVVLLGTHATFLLCVILDAFFVLLSKDCGS